MKYSKELLKGSTPILVMSVLKGGDLYGYKIIKELEQRSQNVFEMSEGTLYPILHALEKEKFLTSYWEEKAENVNIITLPKEVPKNLPTKRRNSFPIQRTLSGF